VNQILRAARPQEIYNLGAQSHVRVSFDIPEYTAQTVAMGTLRLLEGLRELGPSCRFYQASSSEMFGSSPPPQNEQTAFQPRSPYACAKVFAHQLCQNYRDAYGLHISCGILFNHESPRRAIPSSPARSPGPLPASSTASTEALPRQPGRRAATGASPATTSRRCG
jgi:GDPmannose 4,6-dehydratase